MKDMEKSITLIGLPGCGKTTVGNLLSDKLNYKFIDMDYYIEENEGKTIVELFKNGEDYFRNIETETCRELGQKEKTIISSGGGVVKRSINIEYLKINESVESFLLKSPCRIKAIWGFGSTALGVLRKLFKDTEIVNISISKGTTTKIYDVIYQYYSIIGIELEEVKLLDSEGETNTLLNFIRNIKDFSSFVLSKITNH